MRDSVHGGAAVRLDDEIDALCEKAKQLDATIKQIRQNAFRSVAKGSGEVHFFPVILLTEGYPVNPITLDRLREVLSMKSILSSRDIAPVELMDLVDLEIVEAVADAGGPSLVDIIKSKHEGTMRLASVTDHVRKVMRLDPLIPQRVRAQFNGVFGRILSVLGADTDGGVLEGMGVENDRGNEVN